MADIVDFPSDKTQHSRHIAHWITDIIAEHPSQEVAKRWAAMASDTCTKFPSAPYPSQRNIPLDVLSKLDDETQEVVLDAVNTFITSYFEDVNKQLLSVHQEILKLQKQVAEHDVGYSKEIP